ncbi:MAG: S-methyl-5'-thioadenosine phosphorylase [Conexibacter sp.]
MSTAAIGIIGGTGFYSFFDDAEQHDVETPYGEPSAAVSVGTIGERAVAFIPRHGIDHRYLPHQINYRANLWALRALGVEQVVAPCAVGSLQAHLPPGAIAVPDQLVDRTGGRAQTYFSGGLAHVPFADPYCPSGRATVFATAAAEQIAVEQAGAMVVIDGPRFSTRAESQWYAAQGWSLVNMTGHPEAVLARELGLCYTAIALVTDFDAGADAESAVTQDEVVRIFEANLDTLRRLLAAVVPALPEERTCPCTKALDGIAPAFHAADV